MEMKPKVVLDEDILSMINEFYSVKLGKKYLNNICFSNPNLESHLCNPQAELDSLLADDGDKKCDFCGNNPTKVCKITCHIHYFCMSVFAYRLGIGDKDLKRAIKHNTRKITYSNLYEEVMNKVGKKEPQSNDAQDLNTVNGDQAGIMSENDDVISAEESGAEMTKTKEVASKEKKPEKKAKSNQKGHDKITDPQVLSGELVTISQAAKIYGCTYVCMKGHVKRGNLGTVELGDTVYIPRSEVLKLLEKRKAKEQETRNKFGS